MAWVSGEGRVSGVFISGQRDVARPGAIAIR